MSSLQHRSPQSQRTNAPTRTPGRSPSRGGTAGPTAAPATETETNGPSLDFAQGAMGNALGGNEFGSRDAIPTQRGPEVTDKFDPRATVSKVKEGERGALIGRGSEIVVRSGKTNRSRELFRVPDGVPAEVVSVSGSALRVRVRVGEKEQVGWVEAANFTNQPFISRTDDSKKLPEAFSYSYFGGDHRPTDPKGKDTAQGALGDCFFIASMAAVANSAPNVIKEAIQYDPKSGKYKVRFYEDTGYEMKPVWVEVDAYLPTEAGNRQDPAYAGDPGAPLWPAIMEKAYAQWKGGYDVIGEGGTGDQAMAELTGVRSRSKDPRRMKEADVIPYFQNALKNGEAIYAGVRNTGTMAVQTPLAGSGSGPYQATLAQTHKWNEVEPGTLSIKDKAGKVGEARDQGEEGDETGAIRGKDVAGGEINYKSSRLSLNYTKGKSPASASDLEVRYEYHGMLDPAKILIGNHAYAFEAVVGKDQLQFYNPWGSYQPKPITAAEFLQYFDSLATNQAPKGKTAK